MKTTTNTVGVFAIIMAGLVIISVVFAIWDGTKDATANETAKMQACVQAGKSWVPHEDTTSIFECVVQR